MGDDRGSVYQDEGVWVYRASALGHCLRALVAARRGLPEAAPSTTDLQYFAEGNLHEPDILDRVLPAHDWNFDGHSQEEVELAVPGTCAVVRGHIDGMSRHNLTQQVVVVDAKSMSDARFRKWSRQGLDAFPEYAWQLSVYMNALNMPGMIAAKNRNNGDFLQRFYEAVPRSTEQIFARVQAVEEYAQDQVPDHQWPACDQEQKFWCNYVYLHEGQNDVTEFKTTEDIRLDELLDAYNSALADENVARSQKDELRRLIILELGTYDSVRTRRYTVNRRSQDRSYISQAEAQKILSKDQLKLITTTTTSDYLTVKPIKE